MEQQPLQGKTSADANATDQGMGDLGRFLRKVGLRLLILAVIWVVFTALLPKRWYLGAEYARWEAVFAKIADLQAAKKPVNLVIGDSRPEMGLASKALHAWNLGLGGTSPVEGYYILEQLAEVPIDTLYLSYSPFHFHSQDCFHNRTEYFGFVDAGYIDTVMAVSKRSADTTFAWNNWTWLDELDKNYPSPWLQRQLRYLPAMHGLDNYRWYFRSYAGMQERMQAAQLSYLFESAVCPRDTSVQEVYLEQRTGGFFPNVVNATYFQKALQAIQKRGITLVWVNMPLNNAIRQPSQKYYADFEAWLHSQLPSDVLYYPLQFQDSCDFKDFSHLDAEAAAAFGQNIANWIRQPAPQLGN